jgi:RimJ/RimL family protein N-acetyltransferase
VSTPEPEYDFPALTEAHLPLVRRWLLEPHVRRWWADPPRDAYPEDELEKYRRRIRGDDADPTLLFLIRQRGRPLGFIQSYRIDDDDEYGRALALDASAVGIDLFIGEPEEIGKGRGAVLIRAFLHDVVFARYDVAECVIGPSVKNTSAIRAYEKAGFHFFKDARVPDERDPEHLMRIRRADIVPERHATR